MSTVLRANLMRLYFPVDLTGNSIMIEKLVSFKQHIEQRVVHEAASSVYALKVLWSRSLNTSKQSATLGCDCSDFHCTHSPVWS